MVQGSVPATALNSEDFPNLSEKRRRAALARLLRYDWHELTEAANASPEHVGNLDRWIARARKANPALSDEQAARLGAKLKADYYKRLSEAGVRARRLAAEIHRTEGDTGAA